MKLIIENIRTFPGCHDIPIAPLTILTGQNSSGKSTVLACCSAVGDEGFPTQPGFNDPPYNLGGYDTIATFKGGKYGRAKYFQLGYVAESGEPLHGKRVNARYRNAEGRPELARLIVQRGKDQLLLEFAEGTDAEVATKVALRRGSKEQVEEIRVPRPLREVRRVPGVDLPFSVFRGLSREVRSAAGSDFVDEVMGLLYPIVNLQTTSLAPVRTRPERVYGQIADSYDPAGNHIPFVLENLLTGRGPVKDRKDVLAALDKFGKESGLFTSVRVKKLGPVPTDPFQVLVTVAGRPANLIDVGYGVSQALPLIVQSALTERNRLLLMQQPEVHLHPRAQAALGTFFADLVARTKKHVVIETHSDYIIDRVRQEVASGTISRDKVSILFFEKTKAETAIHHLGLDAQGNIMNAPPSYRQFFLQEELRLLTR